MPYGTYWGRVPGLGVPYVPRIWTPQVVANEGFLALYSSWSKMGALDLCLDSAAMRPLAASKGPQPGCATPRAAPAAWKPRGPPSSPGHGALKRRFLDFQSTGTRASCPAGCASARGSSCSGAATSSCASRPASAASSRGRRDTAPLCKDEVCVHYTRPRPRLSVALGCRSFSRMIEDLSFVF